MTPHTEDRVLSFMKCSKSFALPMLSWAEAMEQMTNCGDQVVLNSYCVTTDHVDVSRACTIQGYGSIPISMSATAKKQLKGWILMIRSPLSPYEPTLCLAPNIRIDTHS